MQKIYKILLLLSIMGVISSCSIKEYSSQSEPISHELWNELLQHHVTAEGWVDYKGFIQDSVRLNTYLTLLSDNHPNQSNWSEDEQLAYWINAYNAFTIKLIVDHYPTTSIKAIKKGIPFVNSVFDLKFINIEGTTYDLNNIEHSIIRAQFEEPRIHFAINCASYSCPKLQREAFTAERLEEQLQAAAIDFINDPLRNIIEEEELQLSRIFNLYRGDFGQNLIDFLRPFTTVNIKGNAKIKFLKYNWQLNEVPLNS